MICIELNSRDLGVPSLTLTSIVQLHSKLVVTVRDTYADCNWSTRQLHIAHATTYKPKEIERKYIPPTSFTYIFIWVRKLDSNSLTKTKK